LIRQQHDDRIQERPDPQLVTTVLYCNTSWGFYNKYRKHIHHFKHFVPNITDWQHTCFGSRKLSHNSKNSMPRSITLIFKS